MSRGARFTRGRIVGAIGPASRSEPRHLARGRHFTGLVNLNPDGLFVVPRDAVNFCVAMVDESAGKLRLDLGNALPAQPSGGDLQDVGRLSVGVIGAENAVRTLAEVDYRPAGWYRETAGIVDLPVDRRLTAQELTDVRSRPLAIVLTRPGALPIVANREQGDGEHVRADLFVHRLNPGDEVTVHFHATRFGQPLSGARIRLQHLPDSGQPHSALTFPAVIQCDAEGRANAVLRAANPGNPRQFIDGQVYRIAYGLDGHSAVNPSDFLSLLVWDEFRPDVPLTWHGSMERIFTQYANLYPMMRDVMDLGDYEVVSEQRLALIDVLNLPETDAHYMPVTRDLSRVKRVAMIRWLTEVGADGKPLKGTPAPGPAPVAIRRAPRARIVAVDDPLGGKTRAAAGLSVVDAEPPPLDPPLDLTHPGARPFLDRIQGNILKSHGRDYTAQIFIRFGADPAVARLWIAEFAKLRVTSAAQQLQQRNAWRAAGGPGEVFACSHLSYAGYQALGIPESSIPSEPNATYFSRGMKNQATADRTFNDPPAERWEKPFQGAMHALAILAHDDADELKAHVAQVLQTLGTVADAVWVEQGARLEDEFPSGRRTIEHFGFEDGISNPVLILQDAEEERRLRGSTHWDGVAPLRLVLTAEPGHGDRFGSFLVFRKLEQNVRGFKRAIGALAQQLSPATPDVERAGAMAVGRFRDGTPIIPTTAPVPGAALNDFTFANSDPSAGVCPFQAHIRKTNPRGDLPIGMELERTFRIARRGITYGDRPDLAVGSALPTPERGVGLLFMSYQARLDQFAIQQEGSDANEFPMEGVGVDAVIGQHPSPVAQEWPVGSGQRFTMANFVTLLGGEYFFAPSVLFLRELSDVSVA
jgi:Dyp-type peroxidase family